MVKSTPEKEIKISSDVSGEIVELYVQEGDSVKPVKCC
ncbi:MAG: biotin/lipoyl-binding protein [Saprospiraceae bacterium]|nr:biotin/lipoyl-binding protein [Saprospiraceae bacterium]